MPDPMAFAVNSAGKPVAVTETGLRRIPIYAGYWRADLRVMTQVFLKLAEPLPDGAKVKVSDLQGSLWPSDRPFWAVADSSRISPAIHFSRLGYVPGAPKFAFVSYDLGTLGEIDLPSKPEARLVDAAGKVVFQGPLEIHPDKEWRWHQKVWRFDFSSFQTPGDYFLEVPGLGRAGPVSIRDSAAAAPARLLALGLYHQRSGYEKAPPFTRFAHPASHTRPAEIPTESAEFQKTNKHIAAMADKNTENQSAPVLNSVGKSLYPFVKSGSVDVSGGHYDAGDYSKYVINSAQLIHSLVLAVDHFPGVAEIDNLGLPESGDGVPDALQIAMWEARFLLKMQDDDGGFFFLVYPKGRAYELDVLPEHGDPQVVFPKNTAATAACTGALAQLAGSPALLRHDPKLAGQCLAAAKKGYGFLEAAIAKHGFDGSYQTISHYGNFHAHRDELCYAAAALFAATGDKKFERDLMGWWPDPLDGRDKKWGWLPMYESYGSAARVYGLAEEILPKGTCDPDYLAKMQEALRLAAGTHLKLSDANAYGIPLSLSSKRRAQVGWFWAMDPAMDAICAMILEPDSQKRNDLSRAVAMWSGYEAGGNPIDRTFLTGSGPVWRREAVNRISLNDDRHLAAPGIPIGNVVSTPDNLRAYQIDGKSGLRKLFFPPLDQFAFYDRSLTDAYNVKEEWSVATGAKILAAHLFLMAQTEEARKPWKPQAIRIVGLPEKIRAGDRVTARLALPPELNREGAEIIWESPGTEPAYGPEFSLEPKVAGDSRIEAEIVWPDGRRISAVQPFRVMER
ncbi:MAG: glycoside hydrolase family 9 protein [Verrucomicrobia bacterium]|nr:glycoside hydrolase family 9 protein [Verrucomicrobiota bacterium]